MTRRACSDGAKVAASEPEHSGQERVPLSRGGSTQAGEGRSPWPQPGGSGGPGRASGRAPATRAGTMRRDEPTPAAGRSSPATGVVRACRSAEDVPSHLSIATRGLDDAVEPGVEQGSSRRRDPPRRARSAPGPIRSSPPVSPRSRPRVRSLRASRPRSVPMTAPASPPTVVAEAAARGGALD
jgi:hypothetical protein